MTKNELLSIIGELIANNSAIEADSDDSILVDGVEDVMDNIGPNGTEDVTVLFTDGKAIRITAEEVDG